IRRQRKPRQKDLADAVDLSRTSVVNIERGRHLLLHQNITEHVDRGISFHFRDERSSRAEVRQEIEANQFAAELLMPRAMIDALVTGPVDVHDDDLLEDLASRFDVSVQALTYRLTNLGRVGAESTEPRWVSASLPQSMASPCHVT